MVVPSSYRSSGLVLPVAGPEQALRGTSSRPEKKSFTLNMYGCYSCSSLAVSSMLAGF